MESAKGGVEIPVGESCCWYYYLIPSAMNSTQRKTLQAIFAKPVQGNLEWRKVESLLLALGAEKIEGNGSAVTFFLNGQRADFHRPHPQKEALKYRIKALREFLKHAGITP